MTTPKDIVRIKKVIDRWLIDVIVGLNFCPFARPVLADDTVRLVISEARHEAGLHRDIEDELTMLVNSPDTAIATTLIACPWMLDDFLDFNDFCGAVEDTIRRMKLDGVVQLASFHPQYRFEGEPVERLSHYTNRSPVPLFHLLREDHITAAVNGHPDTLSIPKRNVATLEGLSKEDLEALQRVCQPYRPEDNP